MPDEINMTLYLFSVFVHTIRNQVRKNRMVYECLPEADNYYDWELPYPAIISLIAHDMHMYTYSEPSAY